jgi:DNA-binding NarL/FixJ family response regulator
VRSLKLFIVEDSPAILRALQTLLSDIPQVEIVGYADNAREASELIDQRKPDVALLDISLSEGTGIDVSKSIKKTLPATVVIIFTAHDDPQFRAKCHAAGVDYFLNKVDEFLKLPELLLQIMKNRNSSL